MNKRPSIPAPHHVTTTGTPPSSTPTSIASTSTYQHAFITTHFQHYHFEMHRVSSQVCFYTSFFLLNHNLHLDYGYHADHDGDDGQPPTPGQTQRLGPLGMYLGVCFFLLFL